MPLKSTINNTNTQKENIKTVANNIDNKLVELGGEQATDLSDVPNKMQYMIGQYKHFAQGEYTISFIKNDNKCISDGIIVEPNNNKEMELYKFKPDKCVEIPLNLNFEPKIVFVTFDAAGWDNAVYGDIKNIITVNSEEHYVKDNSDVLAHTRSENTTPYWYDLAPLFIESLSREKVRVNSYFRRSDFHSSSNWYSLKMRGCRWIAIG